MYWKHSYIIFLLFMLCATHRVIAQNETDSIVVPKGSVAEKLQNRQLDDTQVLLKQEFTGGGMIHSQGWGLLIRRAKNKTFLRKRLFELEAVSMEHPKEIRVSSNAGDNNGYVYGELNQVVVTRLGYGRHNVLYAKFDRGVEIRYLYIGGFSMAWAKPIYLEIVRYGTGGVIEGVDTERYNPNNPKHGVNNIYGSASPFRGTDKMQFYPGMYGKFGFSFEYAKKRKRVRSIEVGAIIDYYIQDVPMMAKIKNDPYYFTLYLSLHFGTKWYR